MQSPPTDATWEELYDSGQLDQQLAQLNFSGSQQPVQMNQHGSQQGLVMRPLLPEQPQQQALILPATHHVVRARGSQSMALFGGNPSPIPPPNAAGLINGPPPVTIVQSNGYPLGHHNIPPPLTILSNHSEMHSVAQNRVAAVASGNSVQAHHDQQPRPLMSIMAHRPGGYQQLHQIQPGHQNNIMSQVTNQPQTTIHLPKHGQQGPPPPMQNIPASCRQPFQTAPPVRIGPPEGPYTQIPFHHGPPGAIVLAQRPMEPRPIGHIPLDMSVPPPPVPVNGAGPIRAPNAYYHNGIGPAAPTTKHQAQKPTKNKNSKQNYNTTSFNTQTHQKPSLSQPVFPVNNTQQEQMTNVNALAATYNSVQVECDYPRTLYRPPEPKVTILKRPVSTPSNLSLQASGSAGGASDNSDVEGGVSSNGGGGINNIRTKSLKQREEEYAQARLRILGSTEPENSTGVANLGTIEPSASSTSQSTPNVHLVQQKSLAKNKLSAGMSLTAVGNATCQGKKSSPTSIHSNPNVMRIPKGPDGSKGFDVERGKDSQYVQEQEN